MRQILASLLALTILTLGACQATEYDAFNGYQKNAFDINALSQKQVAVYVTGGRAVSLLEVEQNIGEAVDASNIIGTEQLTTWLKEANVVAPLPADFPLLNSNYQPDAPTKALAPLVYVVRSHVQAPYLVACVGWLGANKQEGKIHRWESNPLAQHTGSVKLYVVEMSTGQVVAITHAIVLSAAAASGKVDMDSSKLNLDSGVWEKTVQEAIEKLREVKPVYPTWGLPPEVKI